MGPIENYGKGRDLTIEKKRPALPPGVKIQDPGSEYCFWCNESGHWKRDFPKWIAWQEGLPEKVRGRSPARGLPAPQGWGKGNEKGTFNRVPGNPEADAAKRKGGLSMAMAKVHGQRPGPEASTSN